jgi:hypothetical protein
MLGLKKKEAQQPEPDYEALALGSLKDAEAKLADARKNLQDFVSENFRAVSGGLIYYSSHQRDWLDAKLQELTVGYDKALVKFHSALAEWAKHKK